MLYQFYGQFFRLVFPHLKMETGSIQNNVWCCVVTMHNVPINILYKSCYCYYCYYYYYYLHTYLQLCFHAIVFSDCSFTWKY